MMIVSSVQFSPPEYAVAFFLNALLFSILTPLQHLFGFENSKFVLVIIIMASCFLLPLLLKTDLLEATPADSGSPVSLQCLAKSGDSSPARHN